MIAIIPARAGSQRVKNKNIRLFNGEPLISYSIRSAQKSGLFSEIHVSTDSPEIADVAKSCGASVPFLRDAALSDHHTPLVPVLRWVLDQYNKSGRVFVDVCLLMATAPLIDDSDLISGFRRFESLQRVDPVIAISSFPVPIEWAYNLAENGLMTPAYPGESNKRSQDFTKKYYDSGSFVFMTRDHLTESYAFGSKFYGHILPKFKSVDIDDEEDFQLAEAIHRGRLPNL
jgi:pseudaminic acid cytidylyltransferase